MLRLSKPGGQAPRTHFERLSVTTAFYLIIFIHTNHSSDKFPYMDDEVAALPAVARNDIWGALSLVTTPPAKAKCTRFDLCYRPVFEHFCYTKSKSALQNWLKLARSGLVLPKVAGCCFLVDIGGK